MTTRQTLGNSRPQAGDILRLRVNQKPFGQHELEAKVCEVVSGGDAQQLYAVCMQFARLLIGED